MPRVKRGFTKHRRHSQILRVVKGHRTSRGHLYRTARQEMMRAWNYAYRDRRSRKREMRALWIIRINAAARQHGLPYNRFISGLMRLGITLDRKMLADIAVTQPLAFATLAYQVRGEVMPADVRAAYGAPPAPRVRRATRGSATAATAASTVTVVPADVAEAPVDDTAPVTDEETEPDQPQAALATDAPEAELDEESHPHLESVAEIEGEESGNPPHHAGTRDRQEEGHGDSQQGTSR